MTDAKPDAKPKTTPKPPTKERAMRPSTLVNHIEAYCLANDLGQDDTIGNLIHTIEQDIIAEAKGRG